MERDALAQSRAEYSRLETKLRASLRDCDQRERSLNDAEARLERDRASKVLDLQMLEKRLRDESKHSVEAEVRARKAVEKSLSAARAAQERAEKGRLLLMPTLTAGARRTDGRRKRSSLRGSRSRKPRLPIYELGWNERTPRPRTRERSGSDCELMCIG